MKGVLIVLATVHFVGCALTRTPSGFGNSTDPRDPVVIHSDFDLPNDHPLREELARLRREIAQRLKLPPLEQTIHVRLFDSPHEYRSFMNHQFPGLAYRRAFFVEQDGNLWVYASWGDRIALDLRHEVTHGYLHAGLPDIPLWLDEGLAEYFEVTQDQKHVNRPHVEYLLDRLRLGRWSPNIARLESLRATEEMTQQDYAEGWCWIHWLLHSTPARATLLQEHLAKYRRRDPASPFSQMLVTSKEAPEELVIQHLQSLGKPH